MKKEVRMSIAEKKSLNEREQLKKQAKERERMKREAKLPTTIKTTSERLVKRFAECLRRNQVTYRIDSTNGTYIISITGLTYSEVNQLMKKMKKQLNLSTNKEKTENHAA